MSKRAKVANIIAGAMFLTCFAGHGLLRHYYTFNRPEVMNVEAGRVYPMAVNYGRIVYVSTTDQCAMASMTWAAAIAAAAWGIIAFIVGRRSIKGRFSSWTSV